MQRSRRNKPYIPRRVVPACGRWNYNWWDNTYTIKDPDTGKKVKVSAVFADANGWIV